MKNTKFLLFLALSTLLFACEPKPEAKPLPNEEAVELAPGKDTSMVAEHPYDSPMLIYGSSFGEFFQMLYKTGKFEDMLKFTSSKSIEKFGRDKVLNFYKTMDFAYYIKLKSMNALETPIGVITLNYDAGIMATRNILRMDVIRENDSCKIILKDIKNLR